MADDHGTPAGALVAPTSVRTEDRYGVLSRSTLLRHTLFALVGALVLLGLIKYFSDFRNTQLAPIAYTVCAAAGLTLLVGLSGQISLGHGAFMMVGAYTFALIQSKWSTGHPNLALIGLLAASVVAAALFGALVGVAAARLRGPYLAGATLALAVGLPSLPTYSKLASHVRGNEGMSVTPPNPPAHSGFDSYQWISLICCLCAVLVLWFLANLIRSRIGRSMRAVRDDEVAASLCGLSVARVQVLAFVVSAACAGLAGALLGIVKFNAGPSSFSLTLSLTLLTAVVFGGLGSLAGAIYGSILAVMLSGYWAQDLAKALSIHSDKVTNNLPLLIYGVLLALAMLVAPGGVQGSLRRLVAIAGSTRRR